MASASISLPDAHVAGTRAIPGPPRLSRVSSLPACLSGVPGGDRHGARAPRGAEGRKEAPLQEASNVQGRPSDVVLWTRAVMEGFEQDRDGFQSGPGGRMNPKGGTSGRDISLSRCQVNKAATLSFAKLPADRRTNQPTNQPASQTVNRLLPPFAGAGGTG